MSPVCNGGPIEFGPSVSLLHVGFMNVAMFLHILLSTPKHSCPCVSDPLVDTHTCRRREKGAASTRAARSLSNISPCLLSVSIHSHHGRSSINGATCRLPRGGGGQTSRPPAPPPAPSSARVSAERTRAPGARERSSSPGCGPPLYLVREPICFDEKRAALRAGSCVS